jgi:DNA-binding XRE family transcriptional regulator
VSPDSVGPDARGGGAAEPKAAGSEDAFDAALADLARAEQMNQETVPLAIVQRLADGEVPVAVWREYRDQSREQLAEAADVPLELLAAIEAGKEDVSLRLMHAVACALRVDLDDLVPWSVDGDHVTEVAPSP